MEKITRLDIIDLIGSAFDAGPASRETLLATAAAGDARMIAVLHLLPDKVYGSPRDLWYDLPDVPLRR